MITFLKTIEHIHGEWLRLPSEHEWFLEGKRLQMARCVKVPYSESKKKSFVFNRVLCLQPQVQHFLPLRFGSPNFSWK